MNDTPHLSDATMAEAKGRVGPVFAGNITFENVSYSVGDKHILRDVSLTIRAGKVACLLGPSGCGKTTLLKLAAGVIRPTSGRILLDGGEVAGPTRFVPPEKRNVGLMFQDFALFPHMTALENVSYGLYALKREDAERVAELALQRVGLGNLAQHYPSAMSGGEQQRVALARAIVPRPQVILMDEPFSGLDQRLRDNVREDALSILRETQATTLLVTHDPAEALAFADEIFVMREGQLVQRGAPLTLLQRPVSAEVAMMFSTYNVFSGTVRNGRIETALGGLGAGGWPNGSRVQVLVPPHGIEFSGNGVAVMLLHQRRLGAYHRISLRVEGHETPLLMHVPSTGRDIVTSNHVVLNGKDAHIFAV